MNVSHPSKGTALAARQEDPSTGALPKADHDVALHPLLGMRSDERESELSALTRRASDIVDRVLRGRRLRSGLNAEDVADARASVLLRIVQRLQSVGAPTETAAIRSFDDYVAKVAFHAVDDLLRVRYPARTRLKNRVRYAIKSDPRFTIQTVEQAITCSLAQWPSIRPASVALDRGTATAEMLDETRAADAIHAVLAAHGRPMSLDELVEDLSELWRIDRADDAVPPPVEELHIADPAPLPGVEMEARQSLRLLWDEIRALPERQRAALLLHLRDDDCVSAVPLLIASGVARFGEIALAAGLSEHRLEELWEELPMADLRIAQILSTTRQAVINLRKTARERLTRKRQRNRF